ncbi:hypothetical protein [Micromonospora tulbaghiae]|uniref:hypothetical protein n=1 Tax=Micromonospora tulbaghiae TaxID=479978 RepID=UPI003422B4BE
MSIRGLIAPLYAITCDAEGCDEEYRDRTWFEHQGVRSEAAEEGWQVRPNGGKGSRSAPDLCPQHRTEGGTR